MEKGKSTNREKVKEIVAGIDSKIQELFQSEQYFDYLKFMARFHSYSMRNTILIHAQRPYATRVAGFQAWKNKFGRHVKKGEKGITILAPMSFKKKVEEVKRDPETQAPLLDQNGSFIIEEKEVTIPFFKPVTVFDVSQTDGQPLLSIVAELTGDVQQFDIFMEALKRSSPVTINFKELPSNIDGVFHRASQFIDIREGMSEIQTICAAVHEITHAKLHSKEELDNSDGTTKKDKFTREVEAESVAYAVCQYYGIDTSSNSIGYIASWSKDKSLPELKNSLEIIAKTASSLITDIDLHFAEICRERGIDRAPQPETLYQMEANPLTTGAEDRFFIQEYESTPENTLIPGDVLFYGSAAQCVEVKDRLETGAVTAQEIREQYIREHTAPELPDTPARFAADLHAHLSSLAENGIAVLSVHRDLETHYLDCMNRGEFDTLRNYLRDSAELTGTTNTDLMNRLDALNAQWEASLIYQVEPFIPGSDIDRACIQAYSTMDGERVLYDSIFIGTTAHCTELVEKLNAGTITAQEVRDMPGDDWPPFAPPDRQERTQPAEPEPAPPSSLQPDAPEQTLDEYPMPDPKFTTGNMEQYGNLGGDLLPLSKERAAELFEQDMTVYAVSRDSTLLVFERDEFNDLPADTVFAISREEWETSPDFRQAVADRMNHQQEREAAFLQFPDDCFAVYQLRDSGETRDLRYMPLPEQGADKQLYELAYTGVLTEQDNGHDPTVTLDRLFQRFNVDHPADYQRPSMSVSDIVALKQDGVVSCHYVDRFAFTQIHGFLPENPLKSTEMAMEDNCNMIDTSVKAPSVADLEAQVKAGQSISLMDLAAAVHRESQEKPSVLRKLKKPSAKRKTKSAPKKGAERDR